ncbi:hypothetical protein BpHYR1_005316 [Brachionus plicatilis]|uniref:Uncharacterized protein n=1 Tax=Brachionus plicatilis TaxID=10195 RepID=A0A3M7QAC8_BRAPC|nr:hypothetical protein BpHYR1_005316 [Brachionus plicatilis]
MRCNCAEFAQILQTFAEGERTVVSLCFIYRTILYEISQWPLFLTKNCCEFDLDFRPTLNLTNFRESLNALNLAGIKNPEKYPCFRYLIRRSGSDTNKNYNQFLIMATDVVPLIKRKINFLLLSMTVKRRLFAGEPKNRQTELFWPVGTESKRLPKEIDKSKWST